MDALAATSSAPCHLSVDTSLAERQQTRAHTTGRCAWQGEPYGSREPRPGGSKTLKVQTQPLTQGPIHVPRIRGHVFLLSMHSRLPDSGPAQSFSIACFHLPHGHSCPTRLPGTPMPALRCLRDFALTSASDTQMLVPLPPAWLYNRHLIAMDSWRPGWTGRVKGASRQVRIPPLDLADLAGQVLDHSPSPICSVLGPALPPRLEPEALPSARKPSALPLRSEALAEALSSSTLRLSYLGSQGRA